MFEYLKVNIILIIDTGIIFSEQ